MPKSAADDAERIYDEAEQEYLAAIRSNAGNAELAEIAGRLQRLAQAWSTAIQRSPSANEAWKAADVAVAEVLEGLWGELAAAHAGEPALSRASVMPRKD